MAGALTATGKDEEDDEVISAPNLCFHSVNSADIIKNNGETFVDDSNLGNTSSLPDDPHQVSTVDQLLHSKSTVKNLQLLAQSWERALFTIGGAINFQKSFWFLFNYGIGRMV